MLNVLADPSEFREGDAIIMKNDRSLMTVSYRTYPLMDGDEVIGAACVFMEARSAAAEGAVKGAVDYQVLLRSLGARVERLYTHPLSAVIERLQGMNTEDWSRGREDIIRTLEAGYSTLLGLLEDLEQYLNCTSTREWDSPASYDITELTADAVRDVVAKPGVEGVTVSVKLAGLPGVFGFDRMIKSALEQVIENACIAASFGGKRVEITGREEEGYVRIEVHDTGPGLTPESRQYMFMPFFTDREGRSGLGLSIVKRVMQRLGGRVGAADTGTGTTFFLEFPTSPSPEAETVTAEAQDGPRDQG
jgi:signal transduction histidine kinase